jgi:hypothetical protein
VASTSLLFAPRGQEETLRTHANKNPLAWCQEPRHLVCLREAGHPSVCPTVAQSKQGAQPYCWDPSPSYTVLFSFSCHLYWCLLNITSPMRLPLPSAPHILDTFSPFWWLFFMMHAVQLLINVPCHAPAIRMGLVFTI